VAKVRTAQRSKILDNVADEHLQPAVAAPDAHHNPAPTPSSPLEIGGRLAKMRKPYRFYSLNRPVSLSQPNVPAHELLNSLLLLRAPS